ncbi:MAG: hypothetical protein AB7T49_03380 [Oligoflexales bacterium]
MITALLVTLLVLDVFLVYSVYSLFKRNTYSTELLREISEERQRLNELFATCRDEINIGKSEIKKLVDKASALGADLEMETSAGKSALTAEMERIVAQLSEKVNQPSKELLKQKQSMELLLRKTDIERQALQKALARGETILKCLDRDIPYDTVLRELQEKKYADARELLSRGFMPSEVAKDLGLSIPEVNLIASLR